VTSFQLVSASKTDEPWVPASGSEQVILGDLSSLADGTPVEVATASGDVEEKVVRAGLSTQAPSPANNTRSATPGRVN